MKTKNNYNQSWILHWVGNTWITSTLEESSVRTHSVLCSRFLDNDAYLPYNCNLKLSVYSGNKKHLRVFKEIIFWKLRPLFQIKMSSEMIFTSFKRGKDRWVTLDMKHHSSESGVIYLFFSYNWYFLIQVYWRNTLGKFTVIFYNPFLSD